jgi:hypothetical protein
MTGIMTLSSKLPCEPENATVSSLPIPCATTIAAPEITVVDLPGCDRRLGLQVRQVQLGRASARPIEPADVVGDLEE